MKALKVVMCVVAIALLVSPIYLAYAADMQQTAEDMMKQKASEKVQQAVDEKMKTEEGEMPGKSSMCSPEHMQMMLKEDADKACVVDGVLKDETARNMMMDKIAGDPQMRKTMMDKCMKADKMKMPEGMMKEPGMMQGPGGMMKPEVPQSTK